MNEWLFQSANTPIQVNLDFLSTGGVDPASSGAKLLELPEIQYWLRQLDWRESAGIQKGKIHGSHDYRYENILAKLAQLGMRAGIPELDSRCLVYRQDLQRQVSSQQEEKNTFDRLYAHYDHELIIATYLAMLGYRDEAILQVAENRISLLYEFTRELRYDLYTTAKTLPGVPNAWRTKIIHPDLYSDGQIRLPLNHDIFLLSCLINEFDNQNTKKKINTIITWLFDPRYQQIPHHYGYFWIPGGVYSAKAVCWKFDLPDLESVKSSTDKGQPLIQRAFWLAAFPDARHQDWMKAVFEHLRSFVINDEQALFPKEYLIEKKDSYWAFGAHMGMTENRRRAQARLVESSFWMEMIKHRYSAGN